MVNKMTINQILQLQPERNALETALKPLPQAIHFNIAYYSALSVKHLVNNNDSLEALEIMSKGYTLMTNNDKQRAYDLAWKGYHAAATAYAAANAYATATAAAYATAATANAYAAYAAYAAAYAIAADPSVSYRVMGYIKIQLMKHYNYKVSKTMELIIG